MAAFDYRALDARGREQRGVISAASPALARQALAARQLVPVQVEPVAAGLAQARALRLPSLARPALSRTELLLFTRQLATLSEASVPLAEAVRALAQQQQRPAAARLLYDVQAGISEGERFHEALGRHNRLFTPFYRAVVAAGERAGELPGVLHRLADSLDRFHKLRARVITALIYPAVLAVVALAVVSAMLIFVVPTLAEQFADLNQQLPLLTRWLIGLSTALRAGWWLVVLVALGLAVGMRAWLARPAVRLRVDTALLRAPLIGPFVTTVNASRVVRTLGTLIASGLPVLEGVVAARDSVGNVAVRQALTSMAGQIREGASLSASLRASGLFPPLVVTMAASGEAAGTLPLMLGKAADHLDHGFETSTATALGLLEPLVIVVMGGLVALIVLAIMLPVLQLNTLATG